MSLPTSPLAQHLRIATSLGALDVHVHGDGPTTVLWPSMFVDGSTWDPLIPKLPGRRLVVVDGPGLGRSDPLDRVSSIAEAASAATELLAGLQAKRVIEADRVDWVGNAFGGHVGYELAIRPGMLRSFAAISAPVEPVPAGLRRRIRALHPLLRVFGPVGPVRSAILEAMVTDASAADPAIRSTVTESLGRPSRRSLSLALRSFILDRKDVTAHLPRITVPALFVAGDDRGDWSPEDARRAAEIAPDAVAVTVPRSRTLLPLEQPDAVASELIGFWARIGADS